MTFTRSYEVKACGDDGHAEDDEDDEGEYVQGDLN